MQCPGCGRTTNRPVATDTAERWYQCETCGAEFDEAEALFEQKVHELFTKRFPPGSEGPPPGFDMADLYIEVIEQLHGPGRFGGRGQE